MATATNSVALMKPPITVLQWGELEGPPYYDLINGHLKERPDVAFWHDILLGRLFGVLFAFVDQRDLGILVSSTAKLKISEFHGRQPDIFFIPKALPHLIGKNLFHGVPPLVIEVLSPTTEDEDRQDKRREYAELGVGQYWVVDFPQRRIEVYELRQRSDATRDYELVECPTGETVFRPSIFAGLEIPLAKIWPTEFEERSDE